MVCVTPFRGWFWGVCTRVGSTYVWEWAPRAEEIETAAKRLKNNKSPGVDNINAELLKYGPNELHGEMANIFNRIAATGEIPTEIQQGILIPIPKPGKPAGPPGNLRPIILLSTIRKILSICMITRIHDKLNSVIPNSQAAYRPGRSTTEHVFACVKALQKKRSHQATTKLS